MLEEMFRADYEQLYILNNNLIHVQRGNKHGLINIKGEAITGLIYDDIINHNIGLSDFICVNKNGLFGMIDVFGNEIIPCIYEEDFDFNYIFQDFKPLNTWVKKTGKYLLINKEGAFVNEYRFDEIFRGIINTFCAVRLADKWGIICEISGELLIEATFQEAYPFDFGDGTLIQVKQDDKWGLLTTAGQEILPPIYTEIDRGNNNIFSAKADNTWYIYQLDESDNYAKATE